MGGQEDLYKSLRIHWIQKRVLNKTERRRLLQDFHGLVVLRWVGVCLGQLLWHYPTLESGLDALRSLGVVGVVQSVTRPQIHPEVHGITCISNIDTGSRHCTVMSSPIQQSTSTYIRLTSGRWVSLWIQQKTSTPLRNSAQTELICVTGCQFSLCEWLALLFPGIQQPGPPESYLRRGLVWTWSAPCCPWRSSSTT